MRRYRRLPAALICRVAVAGAAAGMGGVAVLTGAATLATPSTPCAVWWSRRPLDANAWRWDDASRVLRARIRGTRGRLVVQEERP